MSNCDVKVDYTWKKQGSSMIWLLTEVLGLSRLSLTIVVIVVVIFVIMVCWLRWCASCSAAT